MCPTLSRRENSDVTVVITAFNHQGYIEQCLDSVMAQDQEISQVIVVDDQSTDDTADVIERWLAETRMPYQFVRNDQNLGLCATLNQALAMATGAFFCHVSGDDWEEPSRVRRQRDALVRADGDVAFVVGDIREVGGGGQTLVDHDFGPRLRPVIEGGPEERVSALLAENVVPAPGVLARTSLIREVGAYDEELAFEDYDLWLRLADRYRIDYLPGVVANYRVLVSSMLRSPARRAAILRSEADILAKYIARSPAIDEIILQRLLRIAGQILLLGKAVDVTHVLSSASRASIEPWVREAAKTAGHRGGLEALRRRRWSELGVDEP